MLDLRLLHYFVAVAETEHVGRAALRLHISQSPLSRQIQRLEQELGLCLFERERKRIRLTDAGRFLLAEARALLQQASKLESDAARISHGETGRVTIGCVKTALWSDLLQEALRALRKELPAVHIELETGSTDTQIEALLERRLDLAIVHRQTKIGTLTSREILREPCLLVVPRAHHLAAARDIAPSDLSNETWVMLARSLAPDTYDRFLATCAAAGLTVRSSTETRDRTTQLALVEAGLGIACLPRSAKRVAGDDVVFREIPWLRISSSLHVVRRRNLPSKAAAALVALLTKSEPTQRPRAPAHRV